MTIQPVIKFHLIDPAPHVLPLTLLLDTPVFLDHPLTLGLTLGMLFWRVPSIDWIVRPCVGRKWQEHQDYQNHKDFFDHPITSCLKGKPGGP
jgi:hypothetical protein